MKKITGISILACIAIASSFSSCKKTTNALTTTPTTPTTPTTTTPSTPSPNAGNVDGALVSLRVDMTTTTAGITIPITTETALASFFSTTGSSSTLVDAGAVSVNTNALTKTNNSYLKTASAGMTPSDLGFDTNSSDWSIGGAGSVPAFTYNHNTSFPNFTGSIPDSITRSSGFTISFSGNLSNADSVIVLVAAGSSSLTRTYVGTATSATISASDLASFPVITNKSAIIEVVPYSIKLKTQGSKTYAFIKEFAMVKSINVK